MSNKLYTSIPAPKVPRNVFNLSRYNSLTMPYQRVCPVALQEIVPGDKFSWNAELFCRLQPMVAPVMTDQKISLHSFFVPLRTVNSHFAEFMFNNKAGNYTAVLPYTTIGKIYNLVSYINTNVSQADAAEIIRLLDYIGLPFSYRSATTLSLFCSQWVTDNSALSSSEIRVNLAPFLAYTKVWSEYFRDENLVDDPFDTWTGYGYADIRSFVGSSLDLYPSGAKSQATRFAQCFMKLRPRAWQHDRFTSSLPFAQRGPDVLLPVTGTFDVTQDGPGADGSVSWNGDQLEVTETVSGDIHDLDFFGDITGVSTTINDFRRAERLQRWYENSARGGVRPNEATLAHFGVRTPDATLDRAEFLGGSMQPIVVSEVAQTSQTTTGATGSPQGTLAGKGTSYKAGHLFNHFFTEHGFVFVFASALVRPAYWQGVPRVFSRMQRDEYYWPEFALLGEEPVFDKELFVDGSTTEDGVFGYVPRYADYKSALPEVHGDFRTSLDYWVNPRKFANQPALNAQFVFGDPQKKMFAVQSDFADSLLVTIRHGVKASRLMPFYGVPTI